MQEQIEPTAPDTKEPSLCSKCECDHCYVMKRYTLRDQNEDNHRWGAEERLIAIREFISSTVFKKFPGDAGVILIDAWLGTQLAELQLEKDAKRYETLLARPADETYF